jgi:hypothetical protein
MDERLDRAIPLMARGIGAKWWTSAVRMVTGGQATRYVLLHLTNSDDGRDLMKECAWSVSPAGGFMVRRSDNPDQQFLIKPEPGLGPLRDWILNRLARRPERWQDVHAAVRPEWWLMKHVNEQVRELKKEGAITADDAARGAATKSGGWRSPGTPSCQSKPMVDRPVSARASLASLSSPTTCKVRGGTDERGVLCRARNALAGVPDAAGA